MSNQCSHPSKLAGKKGATGFKKEAWTAVTNKFNDTFKYQGPILYCARLRNTSGTGNVNTTANGIIGTQTASQPIVKQAIDPLAKFNAPDLESKQILSETINALFVKYSTREGGLPNHACYYDKTGFWFLGKQSTHRLLAHEDWVKFSSANKIGAVHTMPHLLATHGMISPNEQGEGSPNEQRRQEVSSLSGSPYSGPVSAP
ncbi:hypothetical protein DFH28DRAFT_921357 [Melampsora americana]|nr:hypothetical protein DFH28DRAFT_921357 [Melampsora americana]